MNLRIELCKNKKGPQRFWFRILASNGKILASSEKYLHFADMHKAAKLITHCLEWQYINGP